MRLRRFIVGQAVLLAGLVGQAEAQSLDAMFTSANEAAFANDCGTALRGYTALYEAGVRDPDVEHNAGVCEAREGHLPRAIFHFERALRYRPGDDATRAALARAEDALARARANEEGEAELARDVEFAEAAVKGVSEGGLAAALLVFVVLFFGVLMLRRRVHRESPRLALGIALPILAVIAFTVGLGLLAKRGDFSDGRPGIILGDAVTLRSAPDPRSPEVPEPARGGSRVRVLDEFEGFVRVRVGGREGWAPAAVVGVL